MRSTRARLSWEPSTCTASDFRSMRTWRESSMSLRFSSRVPNRGSRFGVISSAFLIKRRNNLPGQLRAQSPCVNWLLGIGGQNTAKSAPHHFDAVTGTSDWQFAPNLRRLWGQSSAAPVFRQWRIDEKTSKPYRIDSPEAKRSTPLTKVRRPDRGRAE